MSTKSTHANPNPFRSARRRAREFAIQGLYEWQLNPDSSKNIISHIKGAHAFDKSDTEYFETLINGVISNAFELQELIIPHLDRTIDELSPIEHAILLLGVYELKSHIEIPYRIVIDEAIELAKSFGGIDGYKFVNGVLDKVALNLRQLEISADKK